MSYTIFVSGQQVSVKGSIEKVTLNEQGVPVSTEAVDGVWNPSFLAYEEADKRLFALGKTETGAEICEFDCGNGKTVLAGRFPTQTAPLCHVGISVGIGSQAGSGDGKAVIIGGASFGGGEVELFSLESGNTSRKSADAKSVFYRNYAKPGCISHPHCILPSPDGKFFYLVDLGRDCVEIFDCTGEVPIESGRLQLREGDGPRHLLFHPTLPIVWLITEYSNVVYTLKRDTETGALSVLQRESTIPDDYTGITYGASLAYCPQKKTLYASNRGMESIAVYAVAEDGSIRRKAIVPCGGSWPRHIAMTKDGKFLLSCNEKAGRVSVLELDEEGIPGRTVGEERFAGVTFAVDVSD